MQQDQQQPFSQIPEWILDSGISPTAYMLYGALCRYADYNTGKAHPSRATLAKRIGKSPKSVTRYVKELVDIGALKVTVRRNNKPNVYQLVRKRPPGKTPPVNGTPVSRRADSTGQPCPEDRDTHDPKEKFNGTPVSTSTGQPCPFQRDTSVPQTIPIERYPLNETSPVAAAPVTDEPSTEIVQAEIVETDKSGHAEIAEQRTAQALIAEWLDQRQTKPPKRVIGQLSKEIKALLDEGFDYDLVRTAVGQWHQRDLHPATLPSVLDNVQSGHADPTNASAAERRLIAGRERDKALAERTAPSLPPVDPFAAEAQQLTKTRPPAPLEGGAS